jgi:DNA-binding GntR family transcriptional regulator
MEETLSDKVYKKLLVMLRSQSMAMGSQVSDKNLAEELDVSRTPIRMALARLESEGLLEKSSSGGWSLAPISLPDLEEILLLKKVLSSELVRIVAQQLTPEGAKQLEKALVNLKKAQESDDHKAFGNAHNEYEEVLFTMAQRKRFYQYLNQLENQWHRIGTWYDTALESMGGKYQGDLEEHYQAHESIIKAIIAKDGELAAQLQSKHLVEYGALIIKAVENVLVPFFGERL